MSRQDASVFDSRPKYPMSARGAMQVWAKIPLPGSTRVFQRAARLLLAAAFIHLSTGVAMADDIGGQAPILAEDAGDSAQKPRRGKFDAARIGASLLDVVILRPLGVGASATGFGLFIISLPFVAPARDFETSWDIFVVGPVEYTFARPIGVI
jgi:hypothetical protein